MFEWTSYIGGLDEVENLWTFPIPSNESQSPFFTLISQSLYDNYNIQFLESFWSVIWIEIANNSAIFLVFPQGPMFKLRITDPILSPTLSYALEKGSTNSVHFYLSLSSTHFKIDCQIFTHCSVNINTNMSHIIFNVTFNCSREIQHK